VNRNDPNERLRQLPAVHEVLTALGPETAQLPHTLVVDEIRRVLERARQQVLQAPELPLPDVVSEARRALEQLQVPSLRPVINATGVVLHTNLGRAPLGEVRLWPGYSNLEYDLERGARGKRDVHVSGLLERILGAPGIVVNNNAAAVFLTLHELAAGYEVIVSRGELIEIGDGFRIPDIMTRSGAILREVGTTNRTHIEDYREAINERTRLILTVHRSNFRISGFTASPTLEQLVALGRERQIPVYQDLGSGCLVDLRPYGIDEPVAQESVRAGVDLVSFSGDKLLGGPQAGIIAGRPDLVARIRRNPLFRALRVDKLAYQILEQTLRRVLLGRYNEIPALRMILAPIEELRERAARLVEALPAGSAQLRPGESVIGGGSTPEQSIPTWLVAIPATRPHELASRLRRASPPVIARVDQDCLLIDLRTVLPEEEPALVTALRSALEASRPRSPSP